MEDDPPVVGRIFVLLEGLDFGRIEERGGLGSVAFGIHSIRDNHVLETALVSDVVILSIRLDTCRQTESVYVGGCGVDHMWHVHLVD